MSDQNQAEPTPLEKRINDLLEEMDSVTGDSDEYTKMTKNLEVLYKLKPIDKPREPEKVREVPVVPEAKVSPDTVALVVANLAGIILILSYEQVHVVTSKALGFVSKLRI